MSSGTDDIAFRPVGEGRARGDLREASLVLAAVGIEHRIVSEGELWRIEVAVEDEPRARLQLEKFDRENEGGADPAADLPADVDSGWWGVLGYLVVIWLVPVLQGGFRSVDWYGVGALEAGAVAAGEWYRTVTALTLHGDLAHIFANSVFGSVFGLFLGRCLGSGFGWLLVLLAAAAGNALNALVQPPAFSSIGASTATFAALGLVATFVWRRGYLRKRDWKRSFAPVFAAVALLAFTGTGGENTDVLGHLAGFVAGVLTGFAVARFDLRRLGKSGQWLAGGATLLLVAGAWNAAI
jgi:membrane associated rhomboid family serine protease